jgi:hypothetical protein
MPQSINGMILKKKNEDSYAIGHKVQCVFASNTATDSYGKPPIIHTRSKSEILQKPTIGHLKELTA